VLINHQQLRHPEAPRFCQRGEGSGASRHRTMARFQMLHARSLARLKNAVLRDDAIDEDACDARSR
jgi:hypothetical protein